MWPCFVWMSVGCFVERWVTVECGRMCDSCPFLMRCIGKSSRNTSIGWFIGLKGRYGIVPRRVDIMYDI
ncbi:hypothetical protein THOM_2907 [Trachipleistophora hominis]|uniref:Transposable element encoded protein n=1 Tax=Trachipleistophora hominis TaxID=72359 RepID=L7JRY8_TRAHO|nr:hypothetical protein THOM_2907 [Trachipleistophora hominis]